MAGNITTQPKQGRQAASMSSLCILLCLWYKTFDFAYLFSAAIYRLRLELSTAHCCVAIGKSSWNNQNGGGSNPPPQMAEKNPPAV